MRPGRTIQTPGIPTRAPFKRALNRSVYSFSKGLNKDSRGNHHILIPAAPGALCSCSASSRLSASRFSILSWPRFLGRGLPEPRMGPYRSARPKFSAPSDLVMKASARLLFRSFISVTINRMYTKQEGCLVMATSFDMVKTLYLTSCSPSVRILYNPYTVAPTRSFDFGSREFLRAPRLPMRFRSRSRLRHDASTCIYTCTYVHIHTRIYMYVHIYAYTYIYIHVYIYTCIHMYICTYVHIHICIYTYMYICKSVL